MRFQVPQFIEHEAKVIGPFTFRQFAYIGVPAVIAFFLYFTAPFTVFLVAAVTLGAVGFMLAFVSIGGRSLPGVLLNILSFTTGPKTYIWKKGEAQIASPAKQAVTAPQEPMAAPKVKLTTESKVKQLALEIETKKNG